MKNIFGRTSKNWYLKELKQGQKVEFNNGSIKGTGVICGISSNGLPLLGKGYIILPDEKITEYNFSHISMHEVYLNPITEKNTKQPVVFEEDFLPFPLQG